MILLFIFPFVGVPLLIIDVAVIYFSFRPYWQINKTYVTGERGIIENIVTTIGDYAARFGGWFIRFLWKVIILFFRFILWMCSGGPFR